MAQTLISSKKNGLHLKSSSAVETLINTDAIPSATQSYQLEGGRIYVAQVDQVSTNGTATVTYSLQGGFPAVIQDDSDLDTTIYWVKIATLNAADLTTAVTTSTATAGSKIGLFDLRSIESVPYWRIVATPDGNSTGTVKFHIILPQ